MKTKQLVSTLMVVFLLITPLWAQPGKISVLVYASPEIYHYPTLPTAVTQLKAMADRYFVDLAWTQLENEFTEERLSAYSVVVFLQSNDVNMNEDQMECLKSFIRKGGGFVGIHGASVNNGEMDWFDQLVGRVFTGHPVIQTAVMHVSDLSHPSTMHLPDHWVWSDEWYEFGEALTKNQHVLLTVDESTYKVAKGMGKDHPIAWYQEFDGGRSFYTALGHMECSFQDELFLKHILGGIYWAATGLGIVQ